MDFRKLYKSVPVSKNSVAVSKEALVSQRRSKRLENFSRNRKDLDQACVDKGSGTDEKKLTDRRALLLQWKEKKLKERMTLNEKKKKPFVVGIIRHNIGSPLFKDISNVGKRTENLQHHQQNVKKKEDASLLNKLPAVKEFPFTNNTASTKFNFKVNPSLKKLTIPQSPNFLSSKKKQLKKRKCISPMEAELNLIDQKENTDQKQRVLRSRTCRVRLVKDSPKKDKPANKENLVFTADGTSKPDNIHSKHYSSDSDGTGVNPGHPEGIDLLEESDSPPFSCIEIAPQNTLPSTPSSVEATESEQTEEFVISPYVTLTRGKQRNSYISCPIDSAKKQDLRSSEHSCSPSPVQLEHENEEVNEATPYYTKLDTETKRIIDVCDEWSKLVLIQHGIPKEIEDEIDSVVGQSRLLVKDKFQQFRCLIERFEYTVEPPVTKNDLDGFWDMMYIQVEKLDERFANLACLKENNWTQVPVKKPVKSSVTKQMKQDAQDKPVKFQQRARGNFRQFLKDMKKKETAPNSCSDDAVSSGVKDTAGTPRKSGTSDSLLKIVLSNSIHEKKRTSTSAAYNSVRTSLIGKELGTSPIKITDDSLSCESPSNRSILKKSPKTDGSKTKKRVIFGNTSHVSLDDGSDDGLNEINCMSENVFDEPMEPSSDVCAESGKEESVNETFTVEEPRQQVAVSHSVTFDSSLVTPKRSRKRIVSTPGPGLEVVHFSDAKNETFTPRRSTRLMAKAGLSTPSFECDLQQSSRSRKKGSVTPHPKKK